MRYFLALALLLCGAAMADVRPFVVGSMAQIEKQHKERPFILLFWSLTCAYCPKELQMLGEIQNKNPALALVVVAADTPEEAPEIAKRLAGYGLSDAEQWVFADAMPERLRFEIDRRWYGEVPRTYFYNRAHQREVKMGLVQRAFVEDWVRQVATP